MSLENNNAPADGKARYTKSTFSMLYSVAIPIAASPATIWSLLTNAADFPRWNSTVTKIEGRIADGEKIKLRARIAPDRVFSLNVSDVVPESRMVWSDGFAPMFRGVRTYTLTPLEDGRIEFAMSEVFSGVMLPMIKGSLPDFAPAFETYAADLKRAAEQQQRCAA